MNEIVSNETEQKPEVSGPSKITKLQKEFLGLVLPGDEVGTYFCYSTDPGKGKWKDHCVDSVSQLRTQVVHQDTRSVHQNVYFALARFSEAKVGGKPDRKAERAGHFKSFFIDIDVGKEENSYECFEDAYAALMAFVEDADLPQPIIVRSGNGLHAYWPFKAAVPVESWLPVAERFKAMLGASELIFDPSVPADAARVLRLPGTTWRDVKGKGLPDLPVELLSWGDGPVAFQEFAEQIGAREARTASGRLPGADSDMAWLDNPPEYIKRRMDAVIGRVSAKAHGAIKLPDVDLSINAALGSEKPFSISRNKTAIRGAIFVMDAKYEPEWWAVIKAVKGGLELPDATDEEKFWLWQTFMEWSRQYPGFDEQEQQAKLESSQAEHPRTLFKRAKEKNPGWVNPGEDRDCRAVAFQGQNTSEIILTKLSDIEIEKITWLWDGYLARGKFHLLAGHAGVSKTTVALTMAGVVTTGGKWPDGTKAELGNVLIWTGEDDIADTIKPRLVINGADPNRVFSIAGARGEDGKPRPFDPATDMGALRGAAQNIPGGVSLLIVDPIVSAIKGDGHRNAEVRRDLQELVDLGAELDCAILGITHLSKGTKGSRIGERVTGSLAFNALARVVLGCAQMAEGDRESGQVALFRSKSNIGPDSGGFYYDLEQGRVPGVDDIFASKVTWRGPVEEAADEVMARSENGAGAEQSKGEVAVALILSLLTDGPVLAKDILAEGKALGISQPTMNRAKATAKVRDDRWGFGAGAMHWWYLSGKLPADWNDRKAAWQEKKAKKLH